MRQNEHNFRTLARFRHETGERILRRDAALCGAAVRAGILCLAVLAPAGCRKATPAAERASAPIEVAAAPALVTGITQRIEITGDIRPMATVLLASKVPGRLERLALERADGPAEPITEGCMIKRGQTVARIDTATYEARFKQAQAAHAIACAQFDDAAREEKRTLALFEKGAVTEQMKDKAVTARTIAEAARSQAEAALALASIEFRESTPASPLDGVVTRKHLDEGNLVNAGAPLLTIEDTSSVKIVAAVPERHLAAISPGRTRVVIRDTSGASLEAAVSRVYPSIDPATRTGTIEIIVDNSAGKLRAGGFVKVQIDLERIEGAVVIPAAAVRTDGNQAFVYVAEKGVARRRPVKLGIRDFEMVQALDGLSAGDIVLISAGQELSDGVSIKTAQTSEGSAR